MLSAQDYAHPQQEKTDMSDNREWAAFWWSIGGGSLEPRGKRAATRRRSVGAIRQAKLRELYSAQKDLENGLDVYQAIGIDAAKDMLTRALMTWRGIQQSLRRKVKEGARVEPGPFALVQERHRGRFRFSVQ